MEKSSLGDRMKKYEGIPRIHLTPRTPTIIRIDGKAFHTYTKGFERPMDPRISDALTEVGKALIDEIQSAKLVYMQSDEISILINDYETFGTQAWFDKNLQKIVSVSASIATAYFNKSMWAAGIQKVAFFDSRAFVIPREEACNYFLWRYQDCVRNSVSSLAQSMFSSNQLHGVNVHGMKDMMLKSNVDWDSCPSHQKYGIWMTSDKLTISDTFENIKPFIDKSLIQKES